MPGNAHIPFQYIALALASLRMGTRAITRDPAQQVGKAAEWRLSSSGSKFEEVDVLPGVS